MVERGRKRRPPVRRRATLELVDEAHTAGATRIAGPVTTPWNDRNVRLEAPEGTQLTLFTALE